MICSCGSTGGNGTSSKSKVSSASASNSEPTASQDKKISKSGKPIVQFGNGFLKADNKDIVDENSNVIILKGTNLGGWLLQEEWMCPVTAEKAKNYTWTHMDTIVELTSRFGYDKALDLMKTYESNWITEEDFKNMSDLGMNCVRVPFGWWNFLNPDGDGNCTEEWISNDPMRNPGFITLDWVIEMGKKYNLYIILDMHGCPGGQTDDHTSGSRNKCYLFNKTEYQDMMEKLWAAIADRYKNETIVAGYDIMNEAHDFGTTSENDPRNAVYDKMLSAIRNVDNNHMIFVEAIWKIGCLPLNPEDRGWSNVVYSLHAYQWKAADYCADLSYTISMKNYNVPIYIGEFFDTDFMQLCIDNGWSFSSWCYKGASSSNKQEPYSIYCYKTSRRKANVSKDGENKIKEKWGESLQTGSGTFKKTPAYDAWKALQY